MSNVKRWLLAIEVFLVFSPVVISLFLGYLWALFSIIEMVYNFTFSAEYLLGLAIIILASFGVIGVAKLTLLKVSLEPVAKVNVKIVFYILAGCFACVGVLILLKPKSVGEGLPFILPILVSIQLLWINRSALRGDSLSS